MTAGVRVLVITGSMGSGKTTMMGEVSDLLAARGVRHAALDIDAFGNVHDPDGAIDLAAMAYRNLHAAVRNYAVAGVRTFVMAGAIESRAELAHLNGATAATELVVCRLTAPVGVMQERVRARERGMWQQRYVDRVAVLEARLDAAAVEHFSLPNDGARSITALGEEILKRTGWLVP
jgi:hypothetical protein